MRILITGGSGYIGSGLMTALAARADVEEIVDVDVKLPRQAITKVRHVERSVTEDLTDLFTDGQRPIDMALHLAWALNPLRDAAAQRRICIGGTRRFLDGCAAGGVKHLLFVSSATAYGAHPHHAKPVSEDEPLKDRHHMQYSIEKQEAEGLFRSFAEERPGTLLQIVRPTVVAGPNVSNFIFRAMEKAVGFRAYGHDPESQLVHEEDCVAAMIAVLQSRVSGAFNIAAPGMRHISDVYGRFGARVAVLPFAVLFGIAATGWKLGLTRITEAPPQFVYFITYPWLVSSRRLVEETGFRYRFDYDQTLEAVLSPRK